MSLRYTNKRSAARFVVTVITFLCSRSGLAQCELDKLLPDDAAPSETFGVSVAISGDLVVAGAMPLSQQAPGSAYIFRRTGTTWLQEATLTPEDVDINIRLDPEAFVVEIPDGAERLRPSDISGEAVFVVTPKP